MDKVIHPIPRGKTAWEHISSRFTRRTIQRAGLILLAVLLLSYIGLHVWIRIWLYFYIQKYHPDDYRQIKEFYSSTIRFPKEWKNIPPYPGTFNQEIEAIDKKWGELSRIDKFVHSDQADSWLQTLHNSNLNPGPIDWTEIHDYLTKNQLILEMTSTLVERLKKEIIQFSSEGILPKFYENDWFVEKIGNLSRLKNISLAREDRSIEAVEGQLALLPFFVKSPVVNYNGYRNNLYAMMDYIEELQTGIESVRDKNRLRLYLNDLNRFYPYLFSMKKEHLPLYSLCFELDSAGIPFYPEEQLKGIDYVRQIAKKRYPSFGFNQSLSTLTENWLSGKRSEPYAMQPLALEFVRSFLVTDDIEEFYWLSTRFWDSVRSYKEEQNAAARFDNLRLSIATRLYFMETQKYPSKFADLTPHYFKEEFKNRLTGQPYQWDESGQLIVPPTP